MADYQQVYDPLIGGTSATTIRRRRDEVIIPTDTRNKDWLEYQDWLALGNTPDPHDPLPEPPPPQPIELPAYPEQEMDAVNKGYVDALHQDVIARLEKLERQ